MRAKIDNKDKEIRKLKEELQNCDNKWQSELALVKNQNKNDLSALEEKVKAVVDKKNSMIQQQAEQLQLAQVKIEKYKDLLDQSRQALLQ